MIRHSCRSTRSDSDVSGWLGKPNRLAGIRRIVRLLQRPHSEGTPRRRVLPSHFVCDPLRLGRYAEIPRWPLTTACRVASMEVRLGGLPRRSVEPVGSPGRTFFCLNPRPETLHAPSVP